MQSKKMDKTIKKEVDTAITKLYEGTPIVILHGLMAALVTLMVLCYFLIKDTR
jgi:hypothetical protein